MLESWVTMTNVSTFKQIKVINFFCLAIQDLLLLENGILLSCAYDKKVKVWRYKTHEELESFTKPDELRCMDYLPDGGTLLIGTNSGSILSHKIEQWMNYDEMEDIGMIDMGDMEDYGDEQRD